MRHWTRTFGKKGPSRFRITQISSYYDNRAKDGLAQHMNFWKLIFSLFCCIKHTKLWVQLKPTNMTYSRTSPIPKTCSILAVWTKLSARNKSTPLCWRYKIPKIYAIGITNWRYYRRLCTQSHIPLHGVVTTWRGKQDDVFLMPNTHYVERLPLYWSFVGGYRSHRWGVSGDKFNW